MKPQFEVNDFVENEDGSATITVTMDYETILFFAKKGLLATLINAANEAIEDESQDQ
jgi:hypothetical protein